MSKKKLLHYPSMNTPPPSSIGTIKLVHCSLNHSTNNQSMNNHPITIRLQFTSIYKLTKKLIKNSV